MMTWNQFKMRVEAELEKLGVGEDVEIDYIDISVSNMDRIELMYDRETHDIAIS